MGRILLPQGDSTMSQPRHKLTHLRREPNYELSLPSDDERVYDNVQLVLAGTSQDRSYVKPTTMNTVCFSINPGASAQELHRDDWAYHQINPATEIFTERETSLGLFIAGKPSTSKNGATRFLPGSHLWAHGEDPIEELTVSAELEVGDAFIMFGSCYHGDGANTTNDEERLLFSCFSTRGWLRQEENYYLSVPLDIAKKMPTALQKFIGYDISEPFLG
jgi:ectoine hydroxylase-related dioxygenase (phytanoyl-CoA dioxygenase family)